MWALLRRPEIGPELSPIFVSLTTRWLNVICLDPSDSRISVLLSHHLQGFRAQSIEALARILEIEALLKDILLLQSVQGVSDGPWWKIRLGDDILLRQEAP